VTKASVSKRKGLKKPEKRAEKEENTPQATGWHEDLCRGA